MHIPQIDVSPSSSKVRSIGLIYLRFPGKFNYLLKNLETPPPPPHHTSTPVGFCQFSPISPTDLPLPPHNTLYNVIKTLNLQQRFSIEQNTTIVIEQINSIIGRTSPQYSWENNACSFLPKNIQNLKLFALVQPDQGLECR